MTPYSVNPLQLVNATRQSVEKAVRARRAARGAERGGDGRFAREEEAPAGARR